MSYLVVAYPELATDDAKKISEFRRIHDSLFFDVIQAHCTFVFPTFHIEEELFLNEILEKSQGQKSIPFTLRCATITKDAFQDEYHCFLVPDEGYSKIVRLHDRFYSGLLKDKLRLDISYIPHIAVGSSENPLESKAMADSWNVEDFAISGVISKLSVIKYQKQGITLIREIPLQ